MPGDVGFAMANRRRLDAWVSLLIFRVAVVIRVPMSVWMLLLLEQFLFRLQLHGLLEPPTQRRQKVLLLLKSRSLLSFPVCYAVHLMWLF